MASRQARKRQAARKRREAAENERQARISAAASIPAGRGQRLSHETWGSKGMFRGVGWNAKGEFARGESSY